MNTITNKTLETLKYDLVREGLVQFEVVEQAEEIAKAQNINIGQALVNSGFLTVLNHWVMGVSLICRNKFRFSSIITCALTLSAIALRLYSLE